jgi:hypothetical protein
MQCNHCGSSILATDHFCMECGQPLFAQQAAPAQPPAGADAAIWHTPTVLDNSGLVQAVRATQNGETTTCPKCAARLPRSARFCGDCGTYLADASVAVPASVPARPTRVATAALPDPIPPLNASQAPKPAAGPAQPVLPPFRASSWAAQPAPNVEIPDKTMTPLADEPIVPPQPQPAPAWASPPAAPNGQAVPAWASPPAPAAPWSAPQAPAWQPGMPQGTSKAAEFQPPIPISQTPGVAAPAAGPFPPPPAFGSGSPSQAFVQAISAMPMAPALPEIRAPRKGRYPRGQVITMIVAAIVTVLAATGGVLVLVLAR